MIEDGLTLNGRRVNLLPNKALQRTAASLCSRTVQENLLATVAADRAFPAAVAELGRYAANSPTGLIRRNLFWFGTGANINSGSISEPSDRRPLMARNAPHGGEMHPDADEILARVARFCQRTLETGHSILTVYTPAGS